MEYHSWMVEGTVSINMMHHIRKGGIPAKKYPIRTLESLMSAWAMWFWNSEMYWFKGREYIRSFFRTICLVVSQVMAVPVISLCLKALLNLVTKSE